MTQRCYLDYCSTELGHYPILCADHWKMVPHALRIRVLTGTRSERLAALDEALGLIHARTAKAAAPRWSDLCGTAMRDADEAAERFLEEESR